MQSTTKFKIKKDYKFWTYVPVYTSIEGKHPQGMIFIPLEYKPLPENLPKDDADRAPLVKAFYENHQNVLDRKFTQALIPNLKYSLGGVYESELIALWYEPNDRRRQGDRRLVWIDIQNLEIIPE